MLVAIDIGNTNITLGVFPADPAVARPSGRPSPKAVHTWRLSTRAHLTVDDYGPSLLSLLKSAGLGPGGFAGVAVASVVPALDPVFREVSARYLGREALFVGPDVLTGVRSLWDAPAEVGADRIVNAAAAFDRKRRACIVVDFGTATTFDCVSPRGGPAAG